MQHKRVRKFPKQPTLADSSAEAESFIKAERREPEGSLDERFSFGYAASKGGCAWILKNSNFSQICVSLIGGDTKLHKSTLKSAKFESKTPWASECEVYDDKEALQKMQDSGAKIITFSDL